MISNKIDQRHDINQINIICVPQPMARLIIVRIKLNFRKAVTI